MALQSLSGSRNVVGDVISVSQASVNALTLVTGSALDARSFRSVSFTIKVATQSVDWQVFAANLADFSDETVVQANAAIAAAGIGTYSVAQAPFGFYRTKIKSTVTDTPGTATINGLAKS